MSAKRARRSRRLRKGAKSEVWFAPWGSDPRNEKVWKKMGVINAGLLHHGSSVYCIARIDPPFMDDGSDPVVSEDAPDAP